MIIRGRDLQLMQNTAAQLGARTPFSSLPPLPGSRCAAPGARGPGRQSPRSWLHMARGEHGQTLPCWRHRHSTTYFKQQPVSAACSEGPKLEVQQGSCQITPWLTSMLSVAPNHSKLTSEKPFSSMQWREYLRTTRMCGRIGTATHFQCNILQ